jgi:shikimate dehydrogenase
MHNAALAEVGLTGWRYQLLPLAPDLVAETLRALAAAGFRGVNVTIPHKTTALTVCTAPSERAREIGAANTLVYGDDGTIAADNTDAPALLEALGRLRPGARPPATALVLGAGGSARGAVWALRQAGVGEIRIWNRTAQRARELADALEVVAVRDARPAELLVNCTSVGLAGGDPFGELPLTADDLGEFGALADFVYTSAGTQLVDAARRAGVPTVDGLELLVGQGALSFTQFTGLPAPLERMRAAACAQT